jgi:hypothetical protein
VVINLSTLAIKVINEATQRGLHYRMVAVSCDGQVFTEFSVGIYKATPTDEA